MSSCIAMRVPVVISSPSPHCTCTENGGMAGSVTMVRVARREGTSAPIRFVVNTGDSFYPAGSKSNDDPKWESYWGDVYMGMPHDTPWYSVMGNHDYGQDNRGCGCVMDPTGAEQCAQVQKHGYKTRKSKQVWYMPSSNYFQLVQPWLHHTRE